MVPGTYNITALQGATFGLTFTISTDGTPWNLSTYSARMQVRHSVNASTTVLDLSSANGNITLNSSGQVSITVSATVMANISSNRYVYDIELESVGGEVSRVLQGKFIVSAEVTR